MIKKRVKKVFILYFFLFRFRFRAGMDKHANTPIPSNTQRRCTQIQGATAKYIHIHGPQGHFIQIQSPRTKYCIWVYSLLRPALGCICMLRVIGVFACLSIPLEVPFFIIWMKKYQFLELTKWPRPCCKKRNEIFINRKSKKAV